MMTKIKICGLKEPNNTAEVANLNVDFIGLIFAPSPRQVSVSVAKHLSQIVQAKGKKAIGVFVDESDEFIINSAKEARLNGVQIYKNISKDLFDRLKALYLSVWQVVSVGQNLQIPSEIYADLVLFDTQGALKGGNGVKFNWDLLKNYNKEFVLAGGIGTDNALKALEYKPNVLDINSRVENSQGLKDIALIQELLTKVRR